MIWSIFTRRRELQKVASLEGRRDNSEGREGSLLDVQIEQRIVKSAPALLGKAPFDSCALLNGLVHNLRHQPSTRLFSILLVPPLLFIIY